MEREKERGGEGVIKVVFNYATLLDNYFGVLIQK